MSMISIKKRKLQISILVIAIITVGILLILQLGISQPDQQSDQGVGLGKAATSTETVSDEAISVRTVEAGTGQNDSIITVSGEVQSELKATVSAQTSGVISDVFAQLGDEINAGDRLVVFENGSEQASIRQARANLQSQQARLAELQSGSRPEEVRNTELAVETAEQNLRNAEDQLLNTDLQAYVNDGGQAVRTGSLQPPIISGNYNHTETGEYRISLYRSDSKSGYSFRYEGLEQGAQTVSTDNPEPLGSRGLYIQFPENFAKNKLLEWVVPIPNTRSSQYIAAENNKRQAETRLKEARNNLQLTRSGSRPEAVDAQLAQVESARANLQAAQTRLNKTIVTAPFSGSVQSVSIDTGEYVSTGQQVAELINERRLEITTNVGSNVAQKLSVGDTATIRGGGQARIVAIAPGVNNQSGNVTVKLAVEDGSANDLRPGSFTDVCFMVGERNASMNRQTQTLPLSAVITTSDGNYVFVVDENNKLQRRDITLGEITGDGVAVTGQLPNQPIVANANTQDLSVGQKVTITSDGQ